MLDLSLRTKTAIIAIFAIIFIIGAFIIPNGLKEQDVTGAVISDNENEEEPELEEGLLLEDTGSATQTKISQTQDQPNIENEGDISISISNVINVPNPESSSTTLQTSQSTTTTFQTTESTILTTTTTSIQPITVTFIPTEASDSYGYEQISPDNGDLDGTVDLSNDDTRWLTNNNDYITVFSWNNNVLQTNTINNVISYCEVQFVNPKGGNIEFSFNTGSGWSSWICPQTTTPYTTFSCNLFNQGVNSAQQVNNLDLRCRLSSTQTGAIGFAIDSIKTEVTYT